MGPGQGGHPVAQDSRIAPLKKDSQSAPEVGSCLDILQPLVPGEGSAQFFHLPLSTRVPTPKSFGNKGKESNPLPPALLFCSICLPAMCIVQSMAGSVCCTWHGKAVSKKKTRPQF